MIRVSKGLSGYLLLAVIAVAFIVSSVKVTRFRKALPPEFVRAEALMVSPVLLNIISGEFKGMVADYLLMKVSAYLGGDEKATASDWETLHLMLKQAIELDPYFYHTTYMIQGNLVWKKDMAEKSIELLKAQAEFRSWDWELFWYIGFDYLHFLKDRENALRYISKGASLPGAAPIIAKIAARLAQDQQGTRTAIMMLESMYEATEREDYKQRLKIRLDLYIGVLKLEKAIQTHVARFGRRPRTLDELVETGIVETLPKTINGENFIYDQETGRVAFDEISI